MPIEQAQYINTLTPEWPLGTDPQKDGDDHIRMIKQVLQNTFPTLDGVMNAPLPNINAVTNQIRHRIDEGVPEHFQVTDAENTAHVPLRVGAMSIANMAQFPEVALNYARLQDLIYPVGTVLMNTSAANPSTWLGFGTWVQQAGYVAAVGLATDAGGKAENITPGFFSGNWRVQNGHIVTENLSLTSGTTNETGDHAHDVPLTGNDNGGSNGITPTANAGGTATIGTGTAGNHAHDVTGTITIGSGGYADGGSFQPPRTAFYVWVRTA